MVFSSKQLTGIAVLGAIPISLCIQMVDTPLTWFMYVLTFFAFADAKPAQAFKRGAWTGVAAAVINFFWILGGAEKFTGTSILYGVLAISLLAVFFALYCGLTGWMYARLRWNKVSTGAFMLNSAMIGAFWVLLDAFMIYVAKSLALALFVTYIAAGDNIYALQPLAVAGPLILTFLIVFTNALLAHILFYKRWKLLPVPFMLVGLYFGWGALLLSNYNRKLEQQPGKPFNVAIIAENIDPQFKWEFGNSNKFVEKFFLLNVQVAKSGADLAVWSESCIPWNYGPDDDFLKEIDKITGQTHVTHLIGMNTDFKGRTFYNSVYCIEPGNHTTGRYDKRLALSFIEKPFAGMLLPFFNSMGFRVKEGITDKPVITPYGKAGIMLCNESSIPGPANASVRNGATFLVNPGNDGWFTDTYIPKQHFFHARLRAIETRKDIVINNNLGYSGMVRSNGTVVMKRKADEGYVETVSVRNNHFQTPAVAYPYLVIVLAAIIFSAAVVCSRVVVKP